MRISRLDSKIPYPAFVRTTKRLIPDAMNKNLICILFATTAITMGLTRENPSTLMVSGL